MDRQREHEIRGISLKEISDATKISKRFLEAIERTVTMEVAIRASESEANAAYAVVEDRHGIRGRIGSDGSPRRARGCDP